MGLAVAGVGIGVGLGVGTGVGTIGKHCSSTVGVIKLSFTEGLKTVILLQSWKLRLGDVIFSNAVISVVLGSAVATSLQLSN